MARLADQHAKPHHTQITPFAFGMPATRQLPWRNRRNVGVEICGIKRQHVGRKLEPGHSRFRNRDLRLLQLLISDLPGHPMIGLAAEG